MEEKGIYIKKMLTRERILETVVYRMVNRDTNKELLSQAPHIKVMDMAAVYYCIFSQDDNGHAGAFVSSGLCRYFGIRKRELDAAARRNTEAIGFSVQRASKMFGIQEECFPEFMYVLTNRESLYGASILLYPDYLCKLAGRMGTDLFVLPSSIHEVIAVTVSGMEASALQDLVKEINGTESVIRRDEVLSNNVYRWYARDMRLMCVTLDGKRK